MTLMHSLYVDTIEIDDDRVCDEIHIICTLASGLLFGEYLSLVVP
jgi:hypothetical protein